MAALNSAKKQSGAKPTLARASALQHATPGRIAPSAAEYSARKRTRDADADLELVKDGLGPPLAQRRTVVTPGSLAAAASPAARPLAQTVQATPPVHKIFSPFQNSAPGAGRDSWRLGSGRGSSPIGYRRPAPGPSGLVNLGNTCYLNAVLQSLFSLPTFPGAVRAAAAATRAAPGGVLSALAAALAERAASAASGRSSFSPDAVKAAVAARAGAFHGALQHDAHEFFCGLLEAAQNEVLAAEAAAAGRPRLRASESVDPVTRVFGFAVEHRFSCAVCGHASAVVEECTHLSLDLPGVGATETAPGLDALLEGYFAEESVDKACEGCGAGSVAHAALRRVRRLPRILALHVKRFQVTLGPRGTVVCSKVRTPVQLNQALRKGPFCLDAAAPPLPPLQPAAGGAREKENRGDNAARAAMAAAAAADAASPTARHAVAGVRSGAFYNGGYGDMPPPPPPPPDYAGKTFGRRKEKAKGAAASDYWDLPAQKRPVTAAFGDIVGAAGSPVGRRWHAGDAEEDAELARALAESAAEVKAKGGQLEQEEEDLATAIKRSLEEARAEEAAAAAGQGGSLPADGLEGWMTGAGQSGTAGWETTPVAERKATAASAPVAPPPEIVEDDADVGGCSQASGKSEPVLLNISGLPLVLAGAEPVPDAPSPSRVRSYRLTAIVSHHGARAESGHFTADTKDSASGAWHRFNDAHVTEITGAAAVGGAQNDCYMLFYSAT